MHKTYRYFGPYLWARITHSLGWIRVWCSSPFFKERTGGVWLGYMDLWVTVLKELVLTSDPKPQFPKNQRTSQKDP